MGLLKYIPLPKTYCWIMEEPKNKNFMKPTKVLFHKYIFSEEASDMLYESTRLTYQETMLFDNGLHINIYDLGMKTGHRTSLNYFIAKNSQDLIKILYRILSFEHSIEKYDIDAIKNFLKHVETNHPEMMV